MRAEGQGSSLAKKGEWQAPKRDARQHTDVICVGSETCVGGKRYRHCRVPEPRCYCYMEVLQLQVQHYAAKGWGGGMGRGCGGGCR